MTTICVPEFAMGQDLFTKILSRKLFSLVSLGLVIISPALIEAQVVCPCTVWTSSTTPSTPAGSDSSAVELGVKIRATQAGSITGVRFYKGSGNSGTHVGKLWSSTGALLASATFTNETATGWQQVNFSAPVAVAASSTYVASYFAPNGHYAVNTGYFTTAVINPPLRALANGEDGGNGLYLYTATGGFPVSTFNASNYWVDVVFATTTTANNPPVAVSDSYTTNKGQTLTVAASGVLSNDTDADGNLLNAVKVTSPANGTLTFNSNGSFTYIPNATFSGTDGFTYKANDGAADSNVASVSITVNAVVVPVAANDIYSTSQGQTLTVAAPGVLSNDSSPGGLSLTAVKLSNPANGTVTLNANGSFVYTPNPGFTGTDTFTYKANNGSADSNIATVIICPCAIWSASTTPSIPASSDTNAVELGVKFRATQSGSITGIRFYKGSGNSGTHVGKLWSSTGTLLASATFTNETSTGWQQVNFGAPVAVAANTSYVASYFAPSGHYAVNTGYFTTAVSNPPLRALANGEDGGNGLYLYSATGGFPANTSNASNYWVDVVFATTSGNNPPVAVNDSYTTNQGQTLTLAAPGVLANDTDGDGNPLIAVKVTSPSNGTVTLNSNGSFTYTPNAAFTGTDTFTYKANDGAADSNVATVSITVSAAPIPVAANDSYSTSQGQTLNVAAPGVLGNDTSPGGLSLTAVKVTNPANGTVTLNANGSFAYTPNAAFTGTDTFTYKANNGSADSNIATVAIAVSAVPVAVNDTYVTNLGQTLTVAAPGVLSNDTSPGGLALTAVKVTNPANGTLTLNANGSFTYTPKAGFSGTDSFTYKANNGSVDSNVATVNISQNHPPVAANDSYTTNQGQALTVAATGVLGNDTDADSNPLAAIKVTNPASGTVTLNANGSFVYTPNTGFSGSDSFTYKANDGLADSNVATVSITVTTASVPVAVNDIYTGTQGQALTVSTPGVLSNDTSPGGLALTAVKVTNPANGTVTLNANGSFTYTPNAGFLGTDSFTYKANNGSADSNTATVIICPCSIWNSSSLPGISAAGDSNAVELGVKFQATQGGSVTGVRFYKGSGNTGTHVGKLWSKAGVLLASGTFSNETATGWQQVNFAGPVKIAANTTYVVSYFAPNGHYAVNAGYFTAAASNPPLRALADGEDGGNGLYLYSANGGFPVNTFNSSNYWVDPIFVNGGTNTAPVAGSDSYSTNQGQTLTIAAPGVLANDTDADGDLLNAVTVTTPANGAVTLNSNGSFVYIPNAGFSGTDTFTYKANDGVADSNIATVSIAVSSVPIPTAVNDSYSTAQGQTLTVAAPGVLANDTSPGGLPLTAIKLTNPANGTVTLNANGGFVYTPNASFSGTDSFTYKANNGSSDSNAATVSIVISGTPIAVNDAYATNQGQVLSVAAPGVLANDTNPNSVALTAVVVTNPSNGTLVLNGNGSFTYTPNAAFSGTDTFTYKANYSGGFTNTATVKITVNSSSSCPCTIWTASTIPGTPSASDGSSVEVGVKIRSSQAGYITGIRFYKGTSNTGTHIGNLWSSTGSLLATVTFANEGTSGWQQADFSSPVFIVANTTYVASYFAPAGGYAVDSGYFTTGVTRGPLRALANGEDGVNGVYLYSAHSGFPTSSFGSSNYWVDVVFNTSITTNPPVAVSDSYVDSQGQTLSVASPGVLANDSDPNGYVLTAVKVTNPSNGTLTLNANGSFIYVPNGPFVGTDTFTYKANDGFKDSNIVTVAITVNAGSSLSTVGSWSAPATWPLVALNSVLMRTGQVLVYEDSGVSAQVWDPGTGNFTPVPNNLTDLFCSGHSALADGRILVVGGHGTDYNTDIGSADANIFNPSTLQWTQAARMTYRRWYATSTTLPDGRILALSGNDTSATSYVATPEIYNPSTNSWTQVTTGNLTLPLYPNMFVLPNGKVAYTGNVEGDSYPGPLAGSRDTRTFDLSTGTWTTVVPSSIDGDSVMYAPGKIMKTGTSNDGCFDGGASGSSTFVIDFNQPSAVWQQTASMADPRTHHNLTILPDGSVLATGGGKIKNGCDISQPVYEAELWSPVTTSWTTMSAMVTPRLYHSSAVLLPDGRVLVAGGGRDQSAPNELSAEIYSPPYLFKGSRPAISSAPSSTTYGAGFTVLTPNATTIASVALMRPGAATHSFNQDQKFINLTFQQTAGGITVQAPANSNLAPPGYYMLFLVNQSGVPSVAAFIQLQ
jgi:hypothetical protein